MGGARRSARGARHAAAIGLAALLGCSTGTPATDALPAERPAAGDAATDLPPPKAVDFVVQGCRRRSETVCEGEAPLVLSFGAVTGGVSAAGEWDFGDGSPVAQGAVVTHVYGRAGVHDVTLTVAAAAGTLSEEKLGFVVVSGAGPAGACLDDAGCAVGRCICREGCPFPLRGELCLPDGCQALGTCAIPCDQLSCPLASVCADLGLAPAAADPWRAQICLPSCAADHDCARLGFGCRPVPVNGGWQRACVPPVLGETAGQCRGDDGATDGAQCLGGLCLEIGAAGYCSAACDARPCPEGTSCARFLGGATVGIAGGVCLLRCSAGECVDDPLLACQPAQGRGQLDFEIVGPADPPGSTYCAPRRCSAPDACGLSGVCDESWGGFCRLQR